MHARIGQKWGGDCILAYTRDPYISVADYNGCKHTFFPVKSGEGAYTRDPYISV